MCQENWYGMVDLKTLKTYLRIDHDEDDNVLDMMISSAITDLERRSGKSLRHREEKISVSLQNLRDMGDMWRVSVTRAPIKHIVAVYVQDKAMDMSSLSYIVRNEDRESYILFQKDEKLGDWIHSNDISIVYVTGYESVPKDIQLVLYMLISDLYHNNIEYTFDVKRLLMRYRLPKLLAV